MLMIALLMMSTVRYPSGKNINMQTHTRLSTLFFVPVLAVLIYLYKEFALLILTLGYVIYGLVRHLRRRKNFSSNPPSVNL